MRLTSLLLKSAFPIGEVFCYAKLPEWIHPDFVVTDQNMRFIDLFCGHFLDHLFKTDGGVRIASNRGKRVPHIGAHQIGRRQSAADLIVPANAGLRPRMPLHGRAQIPFKRALIVARHAKAHRVHDADQLLSLGIARTCSRPKRLVGFLKATFLHQIARAFNFSKTRRGKKSDRKNYGAHGFLLSFLSTAAIAGDLPRALNDQDFSRFDPAQAALGHDLFYDTILSGNRNIACAHCHHPDFGTGDGLSLGIGEGGSGLGPDRTAGQGLSRIAKRIPRNAQGLWNLGARDLQVMFHDGRLSVSDIFGNAFNSPAEEWLPTGFNSLLAAQAVFPLVAQFEMAGNPGENEVIGAVHDRIDAAWPILAKRVRVDPRYGPQFVLAFDHIDRPEDVTIVEIANALAAFMALEWRSDDSPFDHFLRGDETALTAPARRGMALFYGKANCSDCHSGSLMTDQKFHALGLPAFSPGPTRMFDPYARDVGRMAESNRLEDAYAFRTPMLRNVALTAPYGHNGAYPTLEGIIRHHLDPVGSLRSWQASDAALPEVSWLAASDFIIQQDRFEMARQKAAMKTAQTALRNDEIDDLVTFLEALTGTQSVTAPRYGVPEWFKP